MKVILRLCRLMLGVLVAAFLAAPATAWDMHALAHLFAPVAVAEHHHHDDDGSVEADHHDDSTGDLSTSDDGDSGDGGHDHLPSLLAALAGLMSAGPVMPMPQLSEVRTSPFLSVPPPDLPTPRQIRPPRSA